MLPPSALVAGTREVLTGRDLAGAAATMTYFAGIAVVPWLLIGVWTATWGRSPAAAQRAWSTLRVLLVPASVYGEGLRRACLALDPRPDRLTGWRARVAMVALVVVVPVVSWVLLTVGTRLAPLAPEGGGGGWADLVVRVVVGFTAVWLCLALALTWMFREVAPGRPRWWVAGLGALGTGSFLAGFLHGFQLFLAIPIDVGLPFAGIGVVGGVVAVGLWLYVLHVFLLVGWAATEALERRIGGMR